MDAGERSHCLLCRLQRVGKRNSIPRGEYPAPAKPAEFVDLQEELERIGYELVLGHTPRFSRSQETTLTMKRHPRTKRPPVETTADFKTRLHQIIHGTEPIRRTNALLVRGPKDRGYYPPKRKI